MSRIVLGVSGGIAAYKACLLLRLFTEAGHDVQVVPTRNALQFVGETTWAALSGNPVHTLGDGATRTWSTTSGSAARPTWSWSPLRPPTCSRGPRPDGPTTCSPTSC